MKTANGFPFLFDRQACETCGGQCCRGGAGYIWITIEELEAMAAARKMLPGQFARKYVRLVGGKLSLQEREGPGERVCVLFDISSGHCSVYQSRPRQCRTFPFWEHFREKPQDALRECPGVIIKDS
ncbi:MAG: YkgJ family cysteine cluster protein [Anaerolineales bacterium]|nr:YkgJ family cysteine cluster protein [Anaerolineales bacterium]